MPLVLIMLLKNPDIQTAMVKVIAQNLSEKTGSRVSIEKVSFSLTGNFLISNLQVDDYIGNELIKIEKLSAGYGWYSQIGRAHV